MELGYIVKSDTDQKGNDLNCSDQTDLNSLKMACEISPVCTGFSVSITNFSQLGCLKAGDPTGTVASSGTCLYTRTGEKEEVVTC